MIVEGINCAVELIKANYPVEKVIINKDLSKKNEEILSLAKNKSIKVELVDKVAIEKLTKNSLTCGLKVVTSFNNTCCHTLFALL